MRIDKPEDNELNRNGDNGLIRALNKATAHHNGRQNEESDYIINGLLLCHKAEYHRERKYCKNAEYRGIINDI